LLKDKKIIINFEDNKAYLTSDKWLDIKQLGLPNTAIKKQFTKSSLLVEIKRYVPHEKEIRVEVISHYEKKMPFTRFQISLGSDIDCIEKIVLLKLSTPALLAMLKRGTTPIYNEPITKPIPIEGNPIRSDKIPFIPIKKTIKDSFFIPISKLQFENGYISFEKKIKGLKEKVNFKILNKTIRKEFNPIKKYFSKVLQKKKVEVFVMLEVVGRKATKIKINSSDLDMINEEVIDKVQLNVLNDFTNLELSNSDKTSFTFNDIIKNLPKDIQIDSFINEDKELIDKLLKIASTKHFNQLSFLASKHAHTLMKLRFVFKPFAFLFLIEGKNNYHIVWETFNTEEATYIWHTDKQIKKLKDLFETVNRDILFIKKHGKKTFLGSQNEISRIIHSYLGEGHKKWKKELLEIIN
jgi:hypothetical protein